MPAMYCEKCEGNKSYAALSQNNMYGKGNRMHNPLGKETAGKKFRCTVCGNLR